MPGENEFSTFRRFDITECRLGETHRVAVPASLFFPVLCSFLAYRKLQKLLPRLEATRSTPSSLSATPQRYVSVITLLFLPPIVPALLMLVYLFIADAPAVE